MTPGTEADSSPRPLHVSSAVAAALGVWLLLEVLRLWFPSVAFIFGRAGSTPPEQLGLFGLLPFALAFLAAPLVRWRGATSSLRAAGAALLLARLAAQVADGGDLLLWSTTVAVVAGMVWLVAAAAGGIARAPLAVGLAAGLALDTIVEVLLGGGSLGWLGALGWVLLVPLLALFGASLWRVEPAEMVLRTAAWPWLLIGPILALHLTLGGVNQGLVAATTGDVVGGGSWTLVAFVTAAIAVGVAVLGVRYAWESRPGRGRPWAGPAAVLVAASATVLLAGQPVVVVAQAVTVPLLAVAAAATATTFGHATPLRHGTATAGGLLLLFLVAFPYYASYDLPLGVWNGAFLLAAGIGLAIGLWRTQARGTSVALPAAPSPAVSAAAIVGIAALVAGVFAVTTRIPEAQDAAGLPVRIGLANLHMGFDTSGRYVADEQATLLAAQGVDIVVLNEVDRGWALNGAQDLLVDVASDLGMPYVFAPAADDIWGNAILSRYPVLESGQEILPDSGGYMIRSVVWVVVDVGGGRELAVVGTHLHHRGDDSSIREPQARRVAEVVRQLADGGRPVVLAGDLNALPGSDDIAPLEDLLQQTARGRPPFTYPAWAPERTIDHVLITPDLRADGLEALDSEVSDHLFLVVSVDLASGA